MGGEEKRGTECCATQTRGRTSVKNEWVSKDSFLRGHERLSSEGEQCANADVDGAPNKRLENKDGKEEDWSINTKAKRWGALERELTAQAGGTARKELLKGGEQRQNGACLFGP